MPFLLLTIPTLAQTDSSAATSLPEPEEKEKVQMFRPTIEAGVVFVNYFGDLTINDRAKGPQIPRAGVTLGAQVPFGDAFKIGMNFTQTTIEANERSTARNLNFQSRLNMLGFGVTYNFNHILNRQDRVYDPFIRVGINAIEYNSKTDLYNSDGSYYYYWSDGTIRNTPEGAEDAPKAVRIQRDYVYETDIEASNLGGLGSYSNVVLGIPLQVGMSLKVGTHMTMNFATGMQFMLTDRIDGSTGESTGVRRGDDKNDRMMLSSITLTYDLSTDNRPKREKEEDWTEGVDMEALANADTDGDGVRDLDDKCPNSEPEAPVDEFGCSPDEDKDGVPDYRDAERPSPPDSWVDSFGVAYTEDQLQEFRLRLLDSNGMLSTIKDTIYVRESPSKAIRKKYAKYSVQISTPNEGISEELSKVILSNSSVKAVKDADSTSILVGQYDNLADALKQNEELQKRGIKTTAIVQENTTGSISTADQRGVFVSDANRKELDLNEETFYRVQIGAFKGKPDYTKFEKAPNVVAIPSPDGYTRYYSGKYKTYDEAVQAKVRLRGVLGTTGMAIKAFGEEHVSEELKNPKTSATPAANVSYTVVLGTYKENVPTKVLMAMIKLKNVSEVDLEDGSTRYELSGLSSYREASDAIKKAKAAGITDASIAATKDGQPISVDQAKALTGE